MSENAVIGDKRVLTAEYLPNRMVHRGPERQEIADALRPLTEEKKPRNVLLYGPPGTGKSTMARHVVEKMQNHMSLASGYANCWRYPSRFKLYHTLLQDMGEKMIHRTGTPTDQLVDKFEEKVRNRPAVVILDEVDQIEDERILYDMVRYNRTGLIMIANNENVFYNLDERIRSSLSSRKSIRFQAYTEEEIMDILRDRRQWGLRDGAIGDDKLRKIASRAKGDARMAINSLRIAAEQAEKNTSEQIKEAYIDEAVPQAQDMNESESLEKLNDDQKILYNIIKDEDSIRPRNLYDRYREEVDRPKVERTLRNYLQEMEKYRLIESTGKGTGTKYVLKK